MVNSRTMHTAQQALQNFYDKLETLEKQYDELTDTDVREAIHLVLNRCFVWGHSCREWPVSFGMFSAVGDRDVSSAIKSFLSEPAIVELTSKATPGVDRLRFLQDSSIRTPEGRQYDEFLGHVDEPLPDIALPVVMFEPGEYDHE